MKVFLPDVRSLFDEDAGRELVVGLRGEEQRRAPIVVDAVGLGAVRQQRLQDVRRARQAGRIMQGSETNQKKIIHLITDEKYFMRKEM